VTIKGDSLYPFVGTITIITEYGCYDIAKAIYSIIKDSPLLGSQTNVMIEDFRKFDLDHQFRVFAEGGDKYAFFAAQIAQESKDRVRIEFYTNHPNLEILLDEIKDVLSGIE